MLPTVWAQSQGVTPLPVLKVSPSSWYVEGQSALGTAANQNFISNAAFVVTREGVVVIDALGSPALASRLLTTIKGVTPLPVTHVIVTHYHADHIYGLQTFKAAGAKIIAHQAAKIYLNSDTARLRLEASRLDLAPWIDAQTHLTLGGTEFQLKPVGPSHTPEDLAVYLPKERVLFAGDLVFRSRIPYVGQADSRQWILALDKLLAFDTAVIVPGHGALSMEAKKDMKLTRDYLVYLRTTMGAATKNMEPFEEAYKSVDWTPFEHLPLFRVANRMNAYNTYLLLEHEEQ
ncbi:MAG: MBL fold metallo-hydrolase [Burkholderiales bacterium PBB4]|nr:MAG: MBL fold metallo-hydrolase [Burkholderiales bacterium PBB4]